MSLLLLFQPQQAQATQRFILDGTNIRAPSSIQESRSSVVSLSRTLAGGYARDYFSGDKRIWNLGYTNVNSTDYALILTRYNQYRQSAAPVSWRINQNNYPVATTFVHINLDLVSFSIKGSDYLRDFNLILSEA